MSREAPRDGVVGPPEREGTVTLKAAADLRAPRLAAPAPAPLSRLAADHAFFHPFALMELGGLDRDPVAAYWEINDLPGRDAPALYRGRERLFDYGTAADPLGGSRSLLAVRRAIWDGGLFDYLRGVSAIDPRTRPPRIWRAVADRHSIVDPLDPAGLARIDVVLFGVHGGTGSLRFRSVPGRRPFLHFSTTPDPDVLAVAERIRDDDEHPFSVLDPKEFPRVRADRPDGDLPPGDGSQVRRDDPRGVHGA